MPDNKLDIFTAMMVAEGEYKADEEAQIKAWQLLIDTGVCWRLQGCFGRMAVSIIEAGICHNKGV